MLQPTLILAAMTVVFVAAALGFHWPVGLSLMLGAAAGTLLAGEGVPLRHLVEGSFGFLDVTLMIAAAMIFMKVLQRNGLLETVGRQILDGFRGQPALLLVALMLFIMFPGMMTGSSSACVFTTGAIAAPVFVALGIPLEETAAIIAIGAVLGMVAPPVNIPAMIIGGGVDMPYIGFTLPLLVLTVPLAVLFVLMLGRRFVASGGRVPTEQLPRSYYARFGLRLYLPLVVVGLLMFAPKATPAIPAASGQAFVRMRAPEPLLPGPGVSRRATLAAYGPALRGTSADTDLFFMDSDRPGGTVLVLGGTHPNEIAGFLTAVLLVEHARANAGRLIVVPRTNGSGFTHNDPQEGSPQTIEIMTPGGPRRFRYGSRNTNPIDQWPDPDVYIHASSRQRLSGSEVRNLNRAFPGRPDGTFTELIALAITTLVKQEGVDLIIDLHEASPEYPIINAIVAHERAMPLAVMVLLEMQLAGIPISLEASPKNLRGLSHRELGDHTPALAVLMETPNPAQGRIRGRTDAALVVLGRDVMYERAARAKRLFVPFDPQGWPIETRVGRHATGVVLFARLLGQTNPGRGVMIDGVPDLPTLRQDGLGRYLHPPR